jgi:hypothetical protein
MTLSSKDFNPFNTSRQNFGGLYEGYELAKTHNKFGEVLPGLSPAAGAYIGDTPFQPFANGVDPNLGFLPSPVAKSIPDPSFGMPQGGAGRDVSTFDQYPAPTYSPNIDSNAFQGFDQTQMKTDGSFASIGAGVGALAGGPVGSALGGVGGTAVDMYLSYQANEERKKADRQRLEEARRQQQFANRQADRDRALAASQYEDTMGFRSAQEGRTQETHELNTKQTRLNMLRDAMNNSMKHNDTVRSIFAKRGVI